MKKFIAMCFILVAGLALTGCGQKGPLIIDQPEPETAKTQEEELAPTR